MMNPVNYFTFDSIPSTNFKVYCSGNQTFGGPEADIEPVSVSGKSGDLLRFNQRYANTEVAYDCWIAEDMRINLRNLRSYLLSKTSYRRLEDTYHPDEFRLGVFTGGLDPAISHWNSLAQFTLTFNCKPQRFLKSGETKVISSGNSMTLINPSYFPSKPLIRIYGNGTLTVSDRQIVVTNNANRYLDFDCELMDAFTGTTNRNADITITGNDFVTLHPGKVTIAKDESISSFEVIPRWFYL